MNLLDYISWHFSKAPLGIVKILCNYLFFCEHFFSIRLLLKTLFYPWKRQTFESGPGFSLGKYFEVVVSNLISRLLGAFIRLILIILGIITEIMLLVIGLLILVIFIFLPVITLPIYAAVKSKEKEKQFRHELLEKLTVKPLTDLSFLKTDNFKNTKVGEFLFSRLETTPENIQTITPEDIYEVVRWYNHAKDEEDEYSRFWDLANLLRTRPIGRDFAYGYTVGLDNYSSDLISEGYNIPHLVGRRAEIDQIQRILARGGQNNVLIVGDPGSGRHAIVLAFALDVFEGKVMPQLINKRVLELNLNLLVSEAKVETEVKGKVSQILKEAVEAGNIILVIDNFERFVGGGKDSVDLTDVFSQVFTRKDIQVIAITDRESYHKTVLPNTTLSKILETVEVKEISQEDTLRVLEHLTPVLEKEENVFIPYRSLTETIKKGGEIGNVPFPEKAIDTLKEAAVLACNKKSKVLKPDFIYEIVSQKTKTPQGGLLAGEKEKLLKLEELLHQYVIDQEQAINAIALSLRRARLEISGKGKPIGTFLFLGPTGVGKTETAKTLARVYFGSEAQMVRIDMSQYQGSKAITSLLGNTETEEPGILTKAVRDTPFTVVLLDEIEKASSDVLNLFLTILDEGYINDSFGRKVSFENTIIIGTSNAGSEFIRQKLTEGTVTETLSKDLTEYVLREKIFTPEFINRFDAVVVYRPLTEEHLKQIARLMLNKLNERLAEKKISVNITEDLVTKIAKAGFDPEFGARPMKRVIAEKVEDYIARRLLNEEILAGDVVDILI